tara:strand:+ start:83 stop:439 length:357 start_codon:yes stop_codon:yes gene_type:complete
MSAAPMPFKNKIAIQDPTPVKSAIGQSQWRLQPPQEMIADAYLWDGAPSNRIIPVGAYLPNYTGPTNSKLMAAQLAQAYPINQRFNGYAPIERRPAATMYTRSPMSWKGVWGGVSGGR